MTIPIYWAAFLVLTCGLGIRDSEASKTLSLPLEFPCLMAQKKGSCPKTSSYTIHMYVWTHTRRHTAFCQDGVAGPSFHGSSDNCLLVVSALTRLSLGYPHLLAAAQPALAAQTSPSHADNQQKAEMSGASTFHKSLTKHTWLQIQIRRETSDTD